MSEVFNELSYSQASGLNEGDLRPHLFHLSELFGPQMRGDLSSGGAGVAIEDLDTETDLRAVSVNKEPDSTTSSDIVTPSEDRDILDSLEVATSTGDNANNTVDGQINSEETPNDLSESSSSSEDQTETENPKESSVSELEDRAGMPDETQDLVEANAEEIRAKSLGILVSNMVWNDNRLSAGPEDYERLLQQRSELASLTVFPLGEKDSDRTLREIQAYQDLALRFHEAYIYLEHKALAERLFNKYSQIVPSMMYPDFVYGRLAETADTEDDIYNMVMEVTYLEFTPEEEAELRQAQEQMNEMLRMGHRRYERRNKSGNWHHDQFVLTRKLRDFDERFHKNYEDIVILAFNIPSFTSAPVERQSEQPLEVV